jgi:hypothetical protein
MEKERKIIGRYKKEVEGESRGQRTKGKKSK